MAIAKPGVPYSCIAASTRASRSVGGAAKALVESSSAAAKTANRVDFSLENIIASWTGVAATPEHSGYPCGSGHGRDGFPGRSIAAMAAPTTAVPAGIISSRGDSIRAPPQQPHAPGHQRQHVDGEEHP